MRMEMGKEGKHFTRMSMENQMMSKMWFTDYLPCVDTAL